MHLVIVIAAAIFGATLGKNRLIVLRHFACWLIRSRPDFATVYIAQIAERAPVIAGGIFAPACDGEIIPAAIAATGGSHHHMVTTVG